MDIHISANHFAALVFDGNYLFTFFRAFVVQQGQSAIHAIGNRISFQNVHASFQVRGDCINIKLGQWLCFRGPEFHMVEDFLKIVGGRSGIDLADHRLSVMQVVRSFRR